MYETKVWCVIIRRKDGSQFLAHGKDGAAVYFNRKQALKTAKDLREHKFKARVEIGTLAVDIKGVTMIPMLLPPSPRKKRGT